MSSAAVASRRHHQLPRAPRRARPPPPSPTAVWPVSLRSVPVGLFLRAVTAAAAASYSAESRPAVASSRSRRRHRKHEVACRLAAPPSSGARGCPPSCRAAVAASSGHPPTCRVAVAASLRPPAVLPRRRRHELGPPTDLSRRRRRELEAAHRLAAPPPPLSRSGHRGARSSPGRPDPRPARPDPPHRPLRPPPSAVRASRCLPRRGDAPPPVRFPRRRLSGRPHGFRRRVLEAARWLEALGGGGAGG
jgi:hypothetical protein